MVGANLLVTEPRIVGEETTVDVVSYDAATGAERWRRPVPGPSVSTLVVVGGEAWYGWRTSPSDPAGCDAAIERVNVNTGAPVATLADLYPFELLVMEGGVYTVTATGAAACSYPQPTGFEVRDPKTGAVRWRGPYGRVAAAANGYVFNQPVARRRQRALAVRAFDADGCGAPTCNGLWTATLGGPGEMMAARNGQVYVQNIGLLGQSFTGVDQRTGLSPRWCRCRTATRRSTPPPTPTRSTRPSTAGAASRRCGPTRRPAVRSWGACRGGRARCPTASRATTSSPATWCSWSAAAVYAFDADGCGQATCAPLVELPAGANELIVASGRVYAASGRTAARSPPSPSPAS